MQTIKITITSEKPTDIIIKECESKEQKITRKLAKLLGIRQFQNNSKK